MTVRERPSRQRIRELATDERKRVEARTDLLGSDGTSKTKGELAKAMADNVMQIPQKLLPFPPSFDVNSIPWIPVQTVQEGKSLLPPPFIGTTAEDCELRKHIDGDGAALPFFVQFDHIEVSIINCSIAHPRLTPS